VLQGRSVSLYIEMVFNMSQFTSDIKNWIQSLKILHGTTIKFKEEVNFDDVEVLSIELDNENTTAVIVIYSDNNFFFDFMSKNDKKMISYNWSNHYKDFQDLTDKILESFNLHWR